MDRFGFKECMEIVVGLGLGGDAEFLAVVLRFCLGLPRHTFHLDGFGPAFAYSWHCGKFRHCGCGGGFARSGGV